MKWYGKLCTDLGEEHPKRREEQVPRPCVEVLVCLRSREKARDPTERAGAEGRAVVCRSLGPDPMCGALVWRRAGANSDGSGVLNAQWRHVGSLKSAVEWGCTPQLASAANQGSLPWEPVVKYLPATAACRHAEKVLLIGIKGHWRGFGWGNNWYGFILTRLPWRTEPRMPEGKQGNGFGSNCSGPGYRDAWMGTWSRGVTGKEAALTSCSIFWCFFPSHPV